MPAKKGDVQFRCPMDGCGYTTWQPPSVSYISHPCEKARKLHGHVVLRATGKVKA